MGKKEGRTQRKNWINLTYMGPERRRLNRIVFMLLWVCLFALFFYRFVISSCIVEGDSMIPTLKVGSTHLVNRWVYFFKQPERGDIVVLTKKNVFPFYMIKRIIGLPGEKVEIKFGRVYIDDVLLRENYVNGRTGNVTASKILRENEYFVLGDNRMYSDDSRYWGPLHRKEIIGRVVEKQLF